MTDSSIGNRPGKPSLAGDHRCCCGQLLARLTPGGVELKCKRCRRLDVIPWDRTEQIREVSHVPKTV